MVGGGDGSVRTVASVLAGTDVPLGILPLGTFNHFARDLGLPLDPSQAVAVLAFGALRSVDLGSMNGEIFLNNSSIGLYPFLVLERERQRRGQHVSKWIAMCPAIPRVLGNLPLLPLSVRVGDLAEACRSPLVFIGNNRYELALTALGRRQRLIAGGCLSMSPKPKAPLAERLRERLVEALAIGAPIPELWLALLLRLTIHLLFFRTLLR